MAEEFLWWERDLGQEAEGRMDVVTSGGPGEPWCAVCMERACSKGLGQQRGWLGQEGGHQPELTRCSLGLGRGPQRQGCAWPHVLDQRIVA